jgi:hypothetical protein
MPFDAGPGQVLVKKIGEGNLLELMDAQIFALGFFQIPPDLVVKSQTIDIVKVI